MLLPFLAAASIAQARTAVAVAPDYPDSVSWTYNAPSQKIADNNALKTCRQYMTNAGHAKLASTCKVMTRAKGPGYGAVVCGEKGCSWSVGYADKQVAVDSAWENCNKAGFVNCQESGIKSWYDDNWPVKRIASKAPKSNCRPKTRTIRCTSNCVNGDCIVTYENGCRLRVQVSPQFNPFNNQWVYPSPSC